MAPTTAAPTHRRVALLPAGPERHRVARLAAGIRTAAGDAGIALTCSYTQRLAAHGAVHCGQLGVTRLGEGVVVHTVPEEGEGLPVVLGYADAGGEWLRDGTRHQAPGEDGR